MANDRLTDEELAELDSVLRDASDDGWAYANHGALRRILAEIRQSRSQPPAQGMTETGIVEMLSRKVSRVSLPAHGEPDMRIVGWKIDCKDAGAHDSLSGPLFVLAAIEKALALQPQTASVPAGDLADVLKMTACKDRAELVDMANIGRSFMEAIDYATGLEGPFKGWAPAEDPAELVVDMFNALDEALAATNPAGRSAWLIGSGGYWIGLRREFEPITQYTPDVNAAAQFARREDAARFAECFDLDTQIEERVFGPEPLPAPEAGQ